MPISFPSKSHGRIPIGFFNIETDMLLMDRYFFFSTDFCEWLIEWADTGKFGRDDKMIYVIEYIEVGGMPGWLNGRPPNYVNKMMTQIEITNNQHLKNLAARSEDCSAVRQSPRGIGPENDYNCCKSDI
jgi:hypothetical protein